MKSSVSLNGILESFKDTLEKGTQPEGLFQNKSEQLNTSQKALLQGC